MGRNLNGALEKEMSCVKQEEYYLAVNQLKRQRLRQVQWAFVQKQRNLWNDSFSHSFSIHLHVASHVNIKWHALNYM